MQGAPGAPECCANQPTAPAGLPLDQRVLLPPSFPPRSDFHLHAFCYNAGPDFAAFRLNQTHMMASAKFRFLAALLKKVSLPKWEGTVLGGRVLRGPAGLARTHLPCLTHPPTHPISVPALVPAAQGEGVAPPHLLPMDRGAGHHGVAHGGHAAALRAPRRIHRCPPARLTPRGPAVGCGMGVKRRVIGPSAVSRTQPPSHRLPLPPARPPLCFSCGRAAGHGGSVQPQ